MTEPVQAAPRRRLDLLDYLRFAAATMVVGYHYLAFGPTAGNIHVALTPLSTLARYGYLGVDLFFLISGFVIMNSARRKSARQFAVARATRLYPAFWPSMLFTAVLLFLWGDRVGLSVSLRQVILNLTMAPKLLGAVPVDGVYWTLLLELEFYGLVFLLLLARQGHRLGALFPFWSIAMLACSLVAPDFSGNTAFCGGYFAYFAVGAILAEIGYDGRWTPLRLVGLASGIGVMLPWAHRWAAGVHHTLQLPVSGTVAVVVVALWVLVIASMTRPAVAGLLLPRARTAGALTYPTYLLHAAAGYVVMSFVIDDGNRWLVYPLTFVGVLVLAAAMHRLEELPVWRPLFAATVGRLVGLVERVPAAEPVVAPVGPDPA